MRIRLIIGITCILAILTINQFSPNPSSISTNTLKNIELNELKEYDFVSNSQRLWAENHKTSAIVLLTTATEIKNDNKNELEKIQLMKKEILNDKSPINQIKCLGLNFASNNLQNSPLSARLQGQLWHEFNSQSKNIIPEPNNFTNSILPLKKHSNIFPRAIELFNNLIVLQQTGCLNEALQANISAIVSDLSTITDSSSELIKLTRTRAVVNNLSDLNELISSCSSWHQLFSIIRNCHSIEQIKLLNIIISKNNNSHKIEQLFTILGQRQNDIQNLIKYIQAYGQNALDNLYMSLPKGPNGIEFVLANPTIKVTTFTPDHNSPISNLKNTLIAKKVSSPIAFVVIKNFIIALLVLITTLSFVPRQLLINSTSNSKNAIYNHYYFITITIAIIVFILLFLQQIFVPEVTEATIDATNNLNTVINSTPSPNTTTNNINNNTFSPLSWGTILVFVILHAIIASNTKRKILTLSNDNNFSFAKKLELLNSLEHDLDLSVFVGLAGTVTSFVIMQFDPSGSRILAYSSTLIGIIISCYLKSTYFQPLKIALIEADQSKVTE